ARHLGHLAIKARHGYTLNRSTDPPLAGARMHRRASSTAIRTGRMASAEPGAPSLGPKNSRSIPSTFCRLTSLPGVTVGDDDPGACNSARASSYAALTTAWGI